MTSSLTKFLKITKSGFFLGLLITVFSAADVHAQNCNIVMACNSLVHISLDEDCLETITPFMILESPNNLPESEFSVEVRDENNNIVPGGNMDGSHIGRTFTVKITYTPCQLTCWGKALIEDKLPPVFTACPDVTLECEDSTEPGPNVPEPTVSDPCGPVTLQRFDADTLRPCASQWVKTITRTWVATDPSGNSSQCVQNIFIRRASLEDIVFPPNYDDLDEPSFSCDLNIQLLPNGAPSPNVTGYPSGVECKNIMYDFNDILFPLCGAGRKVVRHWFVLDWCAGRDTSYNQIIKIIDQDPPICELASDTFKIHTDKSMCTGTFEVPHPNVTDCSDWTYIVGYRVKDQFGVLSANILYDNVSGDPVNGYSVSGLPTDTSMIVYIITDDCGNSSSCSTNVIVEDKEAPTAICVAFTVVSLGHDGKAKVLATSIDDFSKDNCEIDRFEVRRLTNDCDNPEALEFGEYVRFCCEDASSDPNFYRQVVLRVYDVNGNYNDCVANVKVDDKIRPIITCPDNVTIDCEDDSENLTLTGEATAIDNCEVTVSFTDQLLLNECGLGTIRRTWRAQDRQNAPVTCIQTITVIKTIAFTEANVSFPPNISVEGCSPADAHPDVVDSRPTFTNTACANIGVSYEDQIFTGVHGTCLKIVRTWRLIDWCTANPQDPQFIIRKQEIILNDTEAPQIFSGCQNRLVESSNGDCEARVEHNITAHDNCTPAELLHYQWRYDEGNNGTINETGLGSFVNRIYPAGTHRMTFVVTDACENTSMCTYTFTVRDDKKPQPICLSKVVTTIMPTGYVDVPASLFNLKSEAACGLDSDLVFAFNQTGTLLTRRFNCADIPNGVAAMIPLNMYVIDNSGNFDFCEVMLELQDSPSTNACPDMPGAGARVEGKIVDEFQQGLEEAEVFLQRIGSTELLRRMTGESGDFTFEKVAFYGDYELIPAKNDDVNNGVSTLDLVLIQRHILGISTFDSPYKLIAADVNNSKNISSADLVALRRVVLGLSDEFPNNNSWRFIPVNFEFEDPTHPYDFDEVWSIEEVMLDKKDLDFIALKVGDVNNSASANFRNRDLDARARSLELMVENVNYKAGELVIVPVKADFDLNTLGLQFTLVFDPSVISFANIGSVMFNVNEQNINTYRNAEGKIAVSLDNYQGVNVNRDANIFTLTFRAMKDGDLSRLIFASSITKSEIYDADVSEYNLSLRVDGIGNITEAPNQLFQNTPNPFSNVTTIGFYIAQNNQVTLRVIDASGKELWKRSSYMESGKHEIMLNTSEIGLTSGVYFYQLEAADFVETKKMILME
jgi:hypothetical protein